MERPSQLASLSSPANRFSAKPLLSGVWLKIAQAGWITFAVLAFVFMVLSLPGYLPRFQGQLAHLTGSVIPPGAYFFAAASGIASLAAAILSIGLATLIFRKKFFEPMAAFLSYFLLIYGIVLAGPLEHASVAFPALLDAAPIIQGVLMATPLIALMMLFPTGSFVPGWTRWVVLLSIPWSCGLVLVAPFNAESVNQKPFLFSLVALLFVGFSLIGVYAQFYRYRRVSNIEERQQARWAVYGFALWIVYVVVGTMPYMYLTGLPADAPIPWWAPASELGWWLSLNILPVTLTISITRYRLWNIDLVINRTLVYGVLTLMTMALYILAVGGLGNLLHIGNNTFIAFLSTGLIAIVFQPLRQRLQSWVNRWMYGDRDDPVSVLSKLGEQLKHTGSPENTLSSITETVATTLKIPYVAIELGISGEIATSYGVPKPDPVRFPMFHQDQVIGNLLVAPRAEGEAFNDSDQQLLENIAQQAGSAAHAAKLTADLRLSRQKLVTTREEERRRIRRDLHDGLGPTLASLTLQLDAARNLLHSDPEKAEQMLVELKKQNQGTIQEVRNLVHELRPPALDEMGLIGALRSFVEQYHSSPQVELDVVESLPPLPAALEVAAYRIALEAINNVLRHADATLATVSIRLKESSLFLEVRDDGIGMSPNAKPGIGLLSMRERAEELGGRFTVLPSQQGFHLHAELPFVQE